MGAGGENNTEGRRKAGTEKKEKNTSRKEGKQSEIKFDLILNLKTDFYLYRTKEQLE